MREYDSFCYTNKGGREYNQDAVGVNRFSTGSVFVVADGLGGHLHGELASEIVCKTLLSEAPPKEDSARWLQERIAEANERLLELQREYGCNMKSTVVALLLQDGQAHWGHVGDSRLYYLHRGELVFCTEDHSVAYKKYKAGEIRRDQIGQDEDQSQLLRALGNRDRGYADFYSGEISLEPGDGFLLCSDGVWEYLRDGEILADLLKADTARDWGELLLLRVMERIGNDNDNLSFITVFFPE